MTLQVPGTRRTWTRTRTRGPVTSVGDPADMVTRWRDLLEPLHPHDPVMETLRNLAAKNHCVRAWGETGLDFNRMFSPQKDQEKWFAAQLHTAGELDLPLIFHERDSKGRFYEILKAEGPKARKGVIHCFSGTKEEIHKEIMRMFAKKIGI